MKIIEKNLDKITPEVKKIADFLDTTDWVSPLHLVDDKVSFNFVGSLCYNKEKNYIINDFFANASNSESTRHRRAWTFDNKPNEKNEYTIDFSLPCKAKRCELPNCPLMLSALNRFRKNELEQAKLTQKKTPCADKIIEAVEKDESELLNELAQLPYHESVKDELKEIIKVMKYVRICRENELETPKPNLNIVLTINPGMDNYSIAKFINKAALTMKLTNSKFNYPRYLFSEKNGYIYADSSRINVIDELPKWNHQIFDSKAEEKTTKLIKGILSRLEENTHTFMTIIQGTKNELNYFFQENPKLKHTFTWHINVPDLTNEELWEHFKKECEPYNYQFEEGFKEAFFNYILNARKKSPYQNLDFVKYIFHTTMMNEMLESNGVHSVRVLEIGHLPDFKQKQYNLEERLSPLIGMEDIKNSLRELESYLSYNKRIASLNIQQPTLNLHMLFTGNPGTGKTTVARIVAELLYELGYLRENKCIEVERKDLVAGYVGQTALKTGQILENAKGGVLFIDEAYSLAQNERDWFGAEAIATLIKSMEDFKDELVVIFAGYEKEMKAFIDSNSGIASRLGYSFNIKDYTLDELHQIGILRLETMGYTLTDDAKIKFKTLIQEGMRIKNFGNARFVVNAIQKIILSHAKNSKSLPTEKLTIIISDDIPRIEEVIKEHQLPTKTIGFNRHQ